MSSQTAPITWAQRKDSIYVTIGLSDVKDAKIDLNSKSLKFSGSSNGKQYSADLEFFAEVDPSDSVSRW